MQKNKYKYNVQTQQYKEQRGECGSNQAKLSQKFLLSFPPSLSRAELNCGICILSLTRRSYFRFLAPNTFWYSTCQCDFGGLCLNVLNLFLCKSVDLQLWSVYHGRQWFFSETQVTKTMLEKSWRKKRFSEIWALLVYMWIRPYVQFRGIHSSSDFSPIQCSRNVLLGDLRQLDPSHQDGHCKWIQIQIQILKTLVKGDGGFRYLEQKFVGFTF